MITVLRACGAFLLTWITLFISVAIPAAAGAYAITDVTAPVWAMSTLISLTFASLVAAEVEL